MLALVTLGSLCWWPHAASSATVVTAVRVWPASEYTRITLESAQPIEYTVFTTRNPERLVLDMEGVELGGQLRTLPERIDANDPYIARARIALNRPGVVRLVLEVKSEIKPQAFSLKPIGEYAHRLVIDVYPAHPADALQALVDELERNKEPDAVPSITVDQSTAAPTQRGEEPARAEPPGAQAVEHEARPRRAPASPEPARAADKRKPGVQPEVVRLVTVAIDAGHGGEDPGAKGRHGTSEKDVTLAIARKLKARIDAEPNMRAILTRDGDYFVSLVDRVHKARRVRADLFVSVHADAYIKPHARGSSVFALSERGATSAAARWLAKKENEADLIGGVNLDVPDPYVKQVLLDLSQTATISDSIKLGRAVLDQIGGINTLHKARVEQAGFAVLKAPDIPSILVETAFISNPQEEKRLKRADYQDQMALAIVEGIKKYFANNPPLAREKLAANP